MAELTEATLAWLAELNATIRADERAKVAEEVEAAFRHWEAGATTRPRVERGGFLNDRDWCLAIIRGDAARMPQMAQDATEPRPVRDSTSGSAETRTAGFGTSKTNNAHEEN